MNTRSNSSERLLLKYIALAVFFIGCAYSWILIETQIFGKTGDFFDSIFFHYGSIFTDFYNDAEIPNLERHFWTLPPAALVICYLQRIMVETFSREPALVLFSAAWILGLSWVFTDLLKPLWPENWKKRSVVVLALVLSSYPILFCLNRGHFAGLIVILLALTYRDLKFHDGKFSPLFIALAASIKITPIGLVLLFVYRRNWIRLAVTLVAVALITFSSSLLIKEIVPDYGWNVWISGLKLYLQDFAIGGGGIEFDCSVWGGIRSWLRLIDEGSPALYATILPFYQLFMVGVGLALAVGAFFRRWSIEYLFLLICFYILGAAAVMCEYYMPIALIGLIALLRGDLTRISLTKAGLFIAILMAPKPYIMGDDQIRLAELLDPILVMIAFLWIFIYQGKWFGSRNPNHIPN